MPISTPIETGRDVWRTVKEVTKNSILHTSLDSIIQEVNLAIRGYTRFFQTFLLNPSSIIESISMYKKYDVKLMGIDKNISKIFQIGYLTDN